MINIFELEREPSHPGEVLLEDFIKPLGISQTQLAKDLNTTFRTINEIVNLKRSISNEMALKLSKYFGNSPEIWIGLQNDYDFYRVLKRKKKNMEKIKPCPLLNIA